MLRLISSITFIFITLWGGLFIFYKENDSSFVLDYESAKMKYETIILPPSEKGYPDIENQKPLASPPAIIKALYSTGWSAGGIKINHIIDLAKKTEANAVVIDIKDYSGVVSYNIQVPEVLKYGAREVRIPRINALIKRLHDEGIYVIGRLTMFQDPMLAKARPDLAVKNKVTGGLWKDRKGISWIDAGAQDAWDYDISIAKDATARGFDEINFDYIRFPSDGDLSVAYYPFYDPATTYKKDKIREFFRYLRAHTPGMKISADLFGLTTINKDDLGIGQYIEYAYESFDYIAPMVYPSHYATGFLGFTKPAEHPYEVVKNSMDHAAARLQAYLNSTPNANPAKLRPWLQDFKYGAYYGVNEVAAQIKATKDAFCPFDAAMFPPGTPCEPENSDKLMRLYNGWMMWDPNNNYTGDALKPE